VSSSRGNMDLVVPSLLYRNYLEANYELIVDPNYISRTDLVRIKGYWVSKDSKYLAYQFSRNGSDWAELKVVRLHDAQHIDDHLVNLRYSNIAWKDDGFYYSTYPRTDQFGKAVGQQVYYHKIGTEQSEDELVFYRKNPTVSFDYQASSNERFFILEEENDEHGIYNIFYIDFESDQKALTPLLMNIDYTVSIHDSHEGKFIATTSYQANNGYIFEIDPETPTEWRAIAPEYDEALLTGIATFKDRIIAIYQTKEFPALIVFDYKGEILYTLELPIASSIGRLSGNWDEDDLLFTFTSYTIPSVVFKFNIRSYYKELLKQTGVTFDWDKIVYEERECVTEDSVSIPIVIVHHKDMKLDGNNPTILKAYGGYGIISKPSFNPGIVHFVLDGGVFAFAKIRGGGDKGLEWSEAGEGMLKQNSINDFIDVAEFLMDERYTNVDKLASMGASNGGMVVAAAAISRPDLFKAVVPQVAPLDMIRLEEFTVGQYNREEYGTVTDSSSFVNLLSYSPYHGIKKDVNYPAMLIVTSENDDRVPPFHSYKFAAALQNRDAQQNPILIKVEADAGHYGAVTRNSNIDELADAFGFIMYELTRKRKD
jgi:prolyl oligopeptidase